MPKNDKLINSLRKIADRNRQENVRLASERDTPQIYAAIAISLWETLDMPDSEKAGAIEMIFAKSQEVWFDCIDKSGDIIEFCQKKTGIDLMLK